MNWFCDRLFWLAFRIVRNCCSRDVLKCCLVESWAAHANDKNGATHETRIAALKFAAALEEFKGDSR